MARVGFVGEFSESALNVDKCSAVIFNVSAKIRAVVVVVVAGCCHDYVFMCEAKADDSSRIIPTKNSHPHPNNSE
jgi:hypothetical protein